MDRRLPVIRFDSFSFRRKRRGGDEDQVDDGTPSDAAAGDDGAVDGPAASRNIDSLSRNFSIASNSTTFSTGRHNSDSVLLDRQTRGSMSSPSGSGRDPLGLKVLHRPSHNRHADIVFVHGLGGSSRMTWSKHRKLDHFWPHRFLPLEDSVKDARILTFGYNADFRPGSGRSKLSIMEFAKQLLHEMKFAKDESELGLVDLNMGERPIIFVVHSMGGLVVKEAYMKGKDDPTYQNIIDAVTAIVFLSTPHRGTNLAETLNRILQLTFVTTPKRFIEELKQGSPTLQSLNEAFRHMTSKLDIVSFYETRPTPMSGKGVMVLERDSSVLGYPGEVSTPLDADHHGVCKYENREDQLYKTVRNVIVSLVRNARMPDGSSYHQSQAATAQFEEIFGLKEPPERDYNFFRDRWTEGTCSWIRDHAIFDQWQSNTSTIPQVLWIHGTAASGKSILSSFIINFLVQEGHPAQYFFVRAEHEHKRSPSMVLRSIAYQMARAFPSFAYRVRQLESAGTDLASSDPQFIWRTLFKDLLVSLEMEEPLFWVIDGADEIEKPEVLLDIVADIHNLNVPIRILVVSRKTSQITSSMRSHNKNKSLHTIEFTGNVYDFQQYIDRKLDLPGEDGYRKEVVNEILQRAGNNFLWVHLAVSKINTCSSKPAVRDALKELPAGMEALYDRMAITVQARTKESKHAWGERILSWATYSQRPLSVEELSDALADQGLLDIQRTTNQDCGGFVVVDQEGKVALVHETAREYLMKDDRSIFASRLDRKTTNDKLFQRCMERLTDPALRNMINRERVPPLLDYASAAWFGHLSQGSRLDDHKTEELLRFFRGQFVLTWIHAVARANQQRNLVLASQCLNKLVIKLRTSTEYHGSLLRQEAIELFTDWASDLVKLVGKFGTALRRKPDAIYKLIPPFCPEQSVIYRQFGQAAAAQLRVAGSMRKTWDDCLARLPLDQGFMASAVHRAGSRIVVLTNRLKSSLIFVYNTTTFEEERRLRHPDERVYKIQVDKLGERLMSYGFQSTKFWSLTSGQCLKTVPNRHRKRPHSLMILDATNTALVAGEDRCIRQVSLEDSSTEWEEKLKIEDQSQQETITMLNAPLCSAINPEGDMIAFGYRGIPVTAWDLRDGEQIGQCSINEPSMNDFNHGMNVRTLGETIQIAWHPSNGEIFGIQRDGLLFRWDPYEEEAKQLVHTGAHFLAVSHDGSLIATGEPDGTLKVFTTADFGLVYQLVSQDSILDIAFSVDSKRLYDIRGSYGNVWEPNALIRLAESSELSDRSSDALEDSESTARTTLHTEHTFPGLENIVTICGQDQGQLYGYGTESGRAMLCEVGQDPVGDLVTLAEHLSIEQVSWSHDGLLVAIADIGERVHIRRIEKASKGNVRWSIQDHGVVSFPSSLGHIDQLLFHRQRNTLLMISSTGLCAYDTKTKNTTESLLPATMPAARWQNHPLYPHVLLAFSNSSVYAWSWDTLDHMSTRVFDPSRIANTALLSATRSYSGAQSRIGDDEDLIGRVLPSIGAAELLLQISSLTSSGRLKSRYLLFDLERLDLDSDSDLQYTLLPGEIMDCIREPLALLSSGRLIFLDNDKRITMWKLANIRRKSSMPPSHTLAAPEPLYLLPGDWVTANEASQCIVMHDGILLCPRNGDVATVQCAKLHR